MSLQRKHSNLYYEGLVVIRVLFSIFSSFNCYWLDDEALTLTVKLEDNVVNYDWIEAPLSFN